MRKTDKNDKKWTVSIQKINSFEMSQSNSLNAVHFCRPLWPPWFFYICSRQIHHGSLCSLYWESPFFSHCLFSFSLSFNPNDESFRPMALQLLTRWLSLSHRRPRFPSIFLSHSHFHLYPCFSLSLMLIFSLSSVLGLTSLTHSFSSIVLL